MSGKHILKSIEITDGFLKDFKIDYSENLNCIIGPRGTGKTSLLEFTRFVLGSEFPNHPGTKKVSQFESLVENNLAGGKIILTIETKDGMTYKVHRGINSEQIVLNKDGSPANITLEKGTIFSIDIYSQNRIEEIAEDLDSQINLIDKFQSKQINDINEAIKNISWKLDENAREILLLRTEIERLEERTSELPNIEERLKQFSVISSEDSEVINKAHVEKGLRVREAQVLQNLDSAYSELSHAISALQSKLDHTATLLDDSEILSGPNSAIFEEIIKQSKSNRQILGEVLEDADKQISTHASFLAEKSHDLVSAHRTQEEAFNEILEKYEDAKTKASERIELERSRNELLLEKKKLDEQLERNKSLFETRGELFTSLKEQRNARFSIRESIAKMLTEKLAPGVRVSIFQDENDSNYRKLLEKELSQKKSGTRVGTYIQKLLDIRPDNLYAIIQQKEVQKAVSDLINKANISAEQASKIVSTLRNDQVIFDIQRVELIDEPKIELKIGSEYKRSSDLSTGQKCTTILPILLLENESPLLIDQPEDNLDNAYIHEEIVSSIKRVKKSRQLLFVTHNPNIPVLADAEKVIVLEPRGKAAKIRKMGSVDETRELIEKYLEGGEEAFIERGRRYNLNIEVKPK